MLATGLAEQVNPMVFSLTLCYSNMLEHIKFAKPAVDAYILINMQLIPALCYFSSCCICVVS